MIDMVLLNLCRTSIWLAGRNNADAQSKKCLLCYEERPARSGGRVLMTTIESQTHNRSAYTKQRKERNQSKMARIAGVDLPRDKRVEIGLTYIFGIGRTSSNKILEAAKVNPDTRVRDLTDEEVRRISEIIGEHYMVEGDLRREVAMNIKRLQEIGCYRGMRHRKGLPCRGQRTKTNARTKKGPKRTIANKKK